MMTDSNMHESDVRILLVEDDQDDYVILRDMLSDVKWWKPDLDWAPTYHEALEKMRKNRYSVYLFDYRLGERDGLELLEETASGNYETPVILLTGQGDHDVDMQAMRSGASDYLVKDDLSTALLERSIRYAIERKRAESALRRSEQEVRDLSQKILEAEEAERKRIAGEIHDTIGASLAAIKYSLETKLREMGGEPPIHGMSLERIIAMIRETIQVSRRISANLHPAILEDLGIVPAIEWSCRRFQEVYSGISVEKNLEVEESRVPQKLKTAIYRLLQEGLNNIAKHSGATRVRVSLYASEGEITFTVEDNGSGFDIETAGAGPKSERGMGLATMRERVQMTGGLFRILSRKGAGTKVRFVWPPEVVQESLKD